MLKLATLCLFVLTLTIKTATAEEPPAPDIPKAARAVIAALLDYFGEEIKGLTKELPDLPMYHPPEMLPNGDIIIRRRDPAEMPPADDGEVEL